MKTNWTEEADGFRFSGKETDVYIVRDGAHVAPVTYHKSQRGFEPYFVSPWQGENLRIGDPVLRKLRGNFFALPFGAGGLDENGKVFRCHGEVASEPWRLVSAEKGAAGDEIVLEMTPKDVGGTVRKTLCVDDDQSVLYLNAVVSGVSGHYPAAYHPNLRMPKSGRMYLSLSPFETGRVAPRHSRLYEGAEYYFLEPEADFDDLRYVPTVTGELSDCSTFPRAEGFVDLVGMYRSPEDGIVWTVAAYPAEGFAWFSLKNSRVFGATLLWMENIGRHASPWSGRTRVLGCEDMCSYFADATALSQGNNPMAQMGYRTHIDFEADKSYSFPYIEGTMPIPRGFTRVKEARISDTKVEFISVEDEVAEVKVSLKHLL